MYYNMEIIIGKCIFQEYPVYFLKMIRSSSSREFMARWFGIKEFSQHDQLSDTYHKKNKHVTQTPAVNHSCAHNCQSKKLFEKVVFLYLERLLASTDVFVPLCSTTIADDGPWQCWISPRQSNSYFYGRTLSSGCFYCFAHPKSARLLAQKLLIAKTSGFWKG